MSSLDRDLDEIAIARRYAPRDVSATEAAQAIIRDINDMPRATATFVEPEPPAPPTPPIDRVAELLRSLTYGEMMELAEAIWANKGDGEITLETLPAVLHKWSARK